MRNLILLLLLTCVSTVLMGQVASLDSLKQAALSGDARAQYNLAEEYAYTFKPDWDDKEALKWFLLSAGQGYTPAQSKLGHMYKNGSGVPQDYNEAVKWFRLAADKGDGPSQINMARFYSKGQGVIQDETEAFRWYNLAAEQGYDEALFNVGYYYASGRGTTKSYREAYKWLLLACGNDPVGGNNEEFTAYRDVVSRLLSPAEITQARTEAQVIYDRIKLLLKQRVEAEAKEK